MSKSRLREYAGELTMYLAHPRLQPLLDFQPERDIHIENRAMFIELPRLDTVVVIGPDETVEVRAPDAPLRLLQGSGAPLRTLGLIRGLALQKVTCD